MRSHNYVAVANVLDSPAPVPAASLQPTARLSPQIVTVACSPLQQVSPVRPVKRSLFTTLLNNQPEVLGYLKQICVHQKRLAKQQQQMQEHLDTLIAVLSRSPKLPNMPVLHTFTSSVPVSPTATVPPVQTLSVPDPDSPTESLPQSADNNVIFQLQLQSTLERNVAVQLLRHTFTPSELAGHNVR